MAVTLYYLVVPSGSTSPTAAQIVAGANYGAVTVLAHGSVAYTSGATYDADSNPVTGASASTAYDQWWVAYDGSTYGTPVDGAVTTSGPVTSDLADSYILRASVSSDLADSYAIRSAVAQDLADSYSVRSSVAQDLADSYDILAAGTVTSDLADSYAIKNTVSSDLSDSATIRAAVAADIEDAYNIRSAVYADLADSAIIKNAVSADLDDNYTVLASVYKDLIDSYTVYAGSGTGATPEEIWATVLEDGLTAEQMMRILLAAVAGKRAGLGTATEQYMAQDGVTPRITFSPTDASGNGIPLIDGG